MGHRAKPSSRGRPPIRARVSRGDPMSQPDVWKMSPMIQPIVALIAGILILVRPALLNYVVAVYLIIVGILGLVQR